MGSSSSGTMAAALRLVVMVRDGPPGAGAAGVVMREPDASAAPGRRTQLSCCVADECGSWWRRVPGGGRASEAGDGGRARGREGEGERARG